MILHKNYLIINDDELLNLILDYSQENEDYHKECIKNDYLEQYQSIHGDPLEVKETYMDPNYVDFFKNHLDYYFKKIRYNQSPPSNYPSKTLDLVKSPKLQFLYKIINYIHNERYLMVGKMDYDDNTEIKYIIITYPSLGEYIRSNNKENK
jgi:hypothetical protein